MSANTHFYSAWVYKPDLAIQGGLGEFVQAISQSRDSHFVYLAPEETTFGAGVLEDSQALDYVDQIKDAVENRNIKITVLIGKAPEHKLKPAVQISNSCYAEDLDGIDVLTEISEYADIVCWPEFFMFFSPAHFLNTMEKSGNKWPLSLFRDNRNIKQLFTMFNGVPHIHRCEMMDQLAKNDLLADNFVTWREINHSYRFNYWTQEIIDDPRAQYLPDGNLNQFCNRNPSYYRTLLDVVPESNAVIRVWTEKTVRPIVNFRPFLIHGAPGANLKLKELGFEIFEELFDYSFENIGLDQHRASIIAQQLSDLQKKYGPDGYNDLYDQLKPKLIHNVEVLCDLMKTGGSPIGDLFEKYEHYQQQNQIWINKFNRYKENNMENKPQKDQDNTHEGSMGTDRNPPSGTAELSEEEIMKRRIEELRKRDPFIYR